MSKLIDELREAMKRDGRSINELSRVSGLALSGLSRLRSGERGLGADSAERLAHTLGYQIKLERLVKRSTKRKS